MSARNAPKVGEDGDDGEAAIGAGDGGRRAGFVKAFLAQDAPGLLAGDQACFRPAVDVADAELAVVH